MLLSAVVLEEGNITRSLHGQCKSSCLLLLLLRAILPLNHLHPYNILPLEAFQKLPLAILLDNQGPCRKAVAVHGLVRPLSTQKNSVQKESESAIRKKTTASSISRPFQGPPREHLPSILDQIVFNTLITIFPLQPFVGEQRGIPVVAQMPVVNNQRQALLKRDSTDYPGQFVVGSSMETRIFAMSPLEVGGVVNQVGDVEVRGDWREPGAEEGLWGRHYWDIVRGDGIQSPQVEQAKLLCWRREDGANQGISKKGPGDRSTAAALINLIHKVTRPWLVDAKLRGRWLARVPRVWISGSTAGMGFETEAFHSNTIDTLYTYTEQAEEVIEAETTRQSWQGIPWGNV